ncbi:MAG: hypothetical protein ACKO96_14430, partial [Flammeovirgaceae bacterium]
MQTRWLAFMLGCASLLAILSACSSGKAALKQGDYYDAVLNSVNRLRGSPTHKKATLVLAQAYPLAIDFIQTGIQNGLTSDDPRKWRNAVTGYNKINYLNDQIKTSLGAMKVITQPVTKFKELAEAKPKAAEESYQDGIQYMMKNTRDDAKQAYFAFKEANDYQQGYREAIEMMNQAEFNATLRVGYEEINASRINYGSFQPIINSLQRQFLLFKPLNSFDSVKPQQVLRLVFSGYYQDNRVLISSRNENIERNIKVGEKKMPDGKIQDIMETVKATLTIFTKVKNGRCEAMVSVTEVATNGYLQNNQVQGNARWQHDWAVFKGDQ